jgi:hypothetical protein
VLRVLGSTLSLKSEVDMSSRGQKDFREEKRKVSWGHAPGPGNPGSCGSSWKLGFYSLFLSCPRAEMSLWCKQIFPRKEKCFPG